MIRQVFAFLVIPLALGSCSDNKMFTIYLVRHSEKAVSETNPKDPPLTECGTKRSGQLAKFLEDVDLDRIYSSDYQRTRDTALPTAKYKGLELEIYNPGELWEFSELLKSRQEDVLIVGHSNTTPILAGYLIGEEGEPMDETVYDRIYQVVISGDRTRLQVLKSSLICEDI